MKLLLRANQRAGLLGKVVFSIEVRADISPEERANIQKYKLGSTVLYEKNTAVGGSGLLGVASLDMAFSDRPQEPFTVGTVYRLAGPFEWGFI